MKNRMTPQWILVFLTVAVLLLAASSVRAHSPNKVVLDFDEGEKILNVNVVHNVRNVSSHYVEKIMVWVNGKQASEKSYERQDTAGEQKEKFEMKNVKPGDEVRVKAECSIAGSAEASLTIKEKGEKKAEEMKKPGREHKPDEMLKPGTKAPLFKLKDQNGNMVELKKFRNKKNVVLIFYPADDTPGCTKQLCAVRDDIADFSKLDAVVFGVNPQGAESHKNFVKKYNFPFPLLIDKNEKVIKAYGAKGEKYTKRTVYGINRKGEIVFAKRGMPSNKEILKAFKKEKMYSHEKHEHEKHEHEKKQKED